MAAGTPPTVPVVVRYFGPLVDVTGTGRETVEFALPASVAEIGRQLHVKWPGLEAHSYRLAIDETLCNDSETIEQAREIALLPAFSGG
ncbi:MAG: MoaD/ThiS family protein [Spirochaetaceae bacterium]|nr:MAG: MoaD/ThiS family protein [Spirochaetaceae bacterium]